MHLENLIAATQNIQDFEFVIAILDLGGLWYAMISI